METPKKRYLRRLSVLPEESEESSELSSPTSNCNNPFDPVSASPNSAAFVQQHQKKRLHKQQQQQQQQRHHQNSKSLDLLTGPSSSSPGSREHLHTTSSAHHLSRNISDPLSSFSPARSTSRPLVMSASASASASGGGGACSSTHSNSSEPSLYSSGTTLHALSRSDSDIEDIDKTDDEDDDRTFLECKQHPNNTTTNNNSHNHVSSPTSKFCPTSPDSVRSSSCFESALGSPLSSSVYESPASPTSTASRYATPPPPPPQQATSPPSPQPPQPPAQTSSAVNITASPFQSNGARSVFPTNRPPFSYPEE